MSQIRPFPDRTSIARHIKATFDKPWARESFLAWIDCIQNALKLLSDENINSNSGSAGMEDDRRIWKLFYEEYLPIARLLLGSGDLGDVAEVRLCFGNQSYDAVLSAKVGKPTYLEVVFPKDGHHEHHMLKHLQVFGHAPVFSDGGVSDYKEALQSNAPIHGDARDHEERIQETVELVHEALQKKCGNPLYMEFRPIRLLVYVDDGCLLGRTELQDLAGRIRVPDTTPFERIYVVGSLSRKVVMLGSRIHA